MIYTITTITDFVDKINIKGNPYKCRDYRAVGYYLDKDKARTAILENLADIQECRNVYAVLESVPEGVYPVDQNDSEEWFKWNKDLGCFEKSNKPSDLENTYGFSIA